MARDRHPLLVLGAAGQVGRALTAALAPLGDVVALDRAGADFADPESLRAVVRRVAPRVVLNVAAYTAVDRAESEPALAHQINAEAPAIIAREARQLHATIVHFSTDYVFDGQRNGAYAEDDPVNPLSVYGASKLAGERCLAPANPRHLILRTSWVVSAHGTNFVTTILRLAHEQDSLRVVADQHGVPTTATLLADVTCRLLAAMQDAGDADPRWGIYHVVPAGETTRHALAVHVITQARALGAPLRATPDDVVPIAAAEYPAAARRPANSRLDTSKLRTTFGIPLPHWRAGVDAVLAELVQPPAR
jgi:dTDP-4-dehydrorhamnose reductase